MEAKVTALRDRSSGTLVYDAADVGNAAAVERMVGAAIERFSGVDILVNNAVSRLFGPIEETRPADWDRAMAVNLGSAFNTIRCALPGMKARNWGRIVNMASIYGLIGAVNRSSYVVSKTALIGLTRAVALEASNYDITCNALCPGSVNTTHSSHVIETSMAENGCSEDEAVARFLSGKQPTGRFVAPESVAEFVAFLCGPAGPDINGAVLPIDMAWSAS
jgi:3-hydroxybutyrate dehydrogenase